MMGEPYLLQVEGLTVSFDGFRAVDDLTLYVDKNEMRAVIGPNGAGKTTFLDLVSGKTRASAGKVVFRGNDITHLLEHQIVQAGIGRKFQTPSVYEDLTVFENLEMALPGRRTWWGALRSRRTPEVVDKVREVAATIYLEERLHDRAESLGHGQKQWLEIGMLLIQDPELMMLDEPVAGMSPPERERTGRLLQQLCRGRAVLVVEHDMQFVESFADNVTVLHQGRLLAEGKMNAVKNDPRVIDVYLGH
jgi:urea transport system ATP-binding protein